MAEYTCTMERTIALLLEEKKYMTLRDILVTMNPSDVAALFEALPEDRLPLLYRLLPKELAAEVFSNLPPETQQIIIQSATDQELSAIVEELGGEKIDVVKYSSDPAQFIAAALAPADVVDVWMADEGKACRVIVPDDQLSLAIGKEGQNARLAARLTGYKIDIKPESYHDEEEPPAGGAPEAADTAEASAVEPVDAE